MRGRQRGFTLLEILVATVIMVIMAVLAYRTVGEARVEVEMAEGHLARLREVQRAMHLLASDFRTVAPRPVRETIGDGYRAALMRDPNAVALVELTHAGWPNGAGMPRGTVQRVSYRLEERKLIREHWNVTDATLATPPIARELLQDVDSVEIRYMNNGREWVAEWPPVGSTADFGFRLRPLAVEITIVLADYGELRRLIEVPG
ncbi:MAG TPA: type II secretion system minor pseudopilin GspJ [Steroidobacteraceae bacterium]|nr:type II secretion system minor pseudopilin GspJ [Steroidobacteraceae bacterium]